MNKLERKIIMLNDAQRLILLIHIQKMLTRKSPLTRANFEELIGQHHPGHPTQKEGGK